MTSQEAKPERPLHVQVAEALGWTDTGKIGAFAWVGRAPDAELGCGCRGSHCYDEIARYDTSWEATGPLIDAYFPRLTFDDWRGVEPAPEARMQAYVNGWKEAGWGRTKLEAFCRLLLALKGAGKLDKEGK